MNRSSFLNDLYLSSSSSDDESSGSDNDEGATSRSRKRSSGETNSNSYISCNDSSFSSRKDNVIYKLLNREVNL